MTAKYIECIHTIYSVYIYVVGIHIYTYIYIGIHVYIYIYIYIYILIKKPQETSAGTLILESFISVSSQKLSK